MSLLSSGVPNAQIIASASAIETRVLASRFLKSSITILRHTGDMGGIDRRVSVMMEVMLGYFRHWRKMALPIVPVAPAMGTFMLRRA